MMEEEPDSARPEEGKSQDGECHPSASTEMGWGCSRGFSCWIAGGEQTVKPRVRKVRQHQSGGVMAALLEAEIVCPLFPIQGNNAEKDKKAEKKTPDDKVSLSSL